MGIVDTPVRQLRGRTYRETFIIVSMVASCVSALVAPHTEWWDFSVFVLATCAFITRFWAARVLAIGTCISALMMAVVHVTQGTWDVTSLPIHASYFIGTWVLGIAVLWSSDLRQRFERAPGFGPFPNPFAALPDSHLRALTACAIALGSAGHLLLREYQVSDDPILLVQIAAIAASLALLVFGRAFGFIVAVGAGVWAACTFGTQLADASSRSIVVVGFALSVCGTAIALPYAARTLRQLRA
jgi:hypothetical protein